MLSDYQQHTVEYCLSISSMPESFPSLFIHGLSGSGKRTIARALAQKAGLDFVEIPVSGVPPDSLRARLIGKQLEGERALASNTAPGDLGRSSTTLLYFSGLEDLAPESWQEFHKLLTKRRYVDANGTEWLLNRDTWLIGGLTTGIGGAHVGISHWICTAFQRRCSVVLDDSPDELFAIARSIVADIMPSFQVAVSVAEAFRNIPLPHDHLHAVRRWIESLIRMGKEIDQAGLECAVQEDLGFSLHRVVYRGRPTSYSDVRSWLEQFRDELRPIAVHLLKELAAKFYVSQSDIYSAVQRCIDNSGIPQGAQVVFCRWQPLGRSSERVAHILKNQANWRVKQDLDLWDPDSWSMNLQDAWFVIADDFVGTGNTFTDIVKDEMAPLRRLASHFEHSKIRVLVVVGFEDGIRRITGSLQGEAQRVKVIVGHMFADEDRCFHQSSHILNNSKQRMILDEYCREIGRTKLQISDKMHLGYDDFGGLIVFPDTVPNDTLPMFWRSRPPHWRALFPVSGLPEENVPV